MEHEVVKAARAEKKRIRSQKLPAWQRPHQDRISPKADTDRPQLKDPIRKVGKPIRVEFSIALDAQQQEEVREGLRRLLSNKQARTEVSSREVVVYGLLVRESKPVKDYLIGFRNNVCPKPIRRRPPGG